MMTSSSRIYFKPKSEFQLLIKPRDQKVMSKADVYVIDSTHKNRKVRNSSLMTSHMFAIDDDVIDTSLNKSLDQALRSARKLQMTSRLLNDDLREELNYSRRFAESF